MIQDEKEEKSKEVSMTRYKIVKITNSHTIIEEYWDDLPIYSYRVRKLYRGGNIEEFLRDNSYTRIVNRFHLEEFLRRTMILDI